jgi:hypothetical protein
MRKLLLISALGVMLMPLVASAQSPFDGTWKVDMSKVDFPKKPQVYWLQDGMYECRTCVPAYKIKADGTDQAVPGHPYYDTVAIKVINDREIEETDKKAGKVVGTSKTTVTPDGNTTMFEFNDSSNTNSAPVTGKGEAVRVGKAPKGASPLSGSWRTTKIENLSENAITWTYKVSGDELTMTSPTGQTFTAKMDGTEAPMKGDPGISTVSVRKLGRNTIEQTNKRDGKVIDIVKATVSADGKSMTMADEDKLHGTSMKYSAMKQ